MAYYPSTVQAAALAGESAGAHDLRRAPGRPVPAARATAASAASRPQRRCSSRGALPGAAAAVSAVRPAAASRRCRFAVVAACACVAGRPAGRRGRDACSPGSWSPCIPSRRRTPAASRRTPGRTPSAAMAFLSGHAPARSAAGAGGTCPALLAATASGLAWKETHVPFCCSCRTSSSSWRSRSVPAGTDPRWPASVRRSCCRGRDHRRRGDVCSAFRTPYSSADQAWRPSGSCT